MYPFTVTSLASGSSGNCTLVRAGESGLLIDAGIGIRKLLPALSTCDFDPAKLRGIVITHEHTDHVSGAFQLSRKYGIPIVANQQTLETMFRRESETLHRVLNVGDAWICGELSVETFSVPHDAVDPVGINVWHSSTRKKMSLITDAGHVTDTMRSAIRGSQLLIIEANHDVIRLRAGEYPAYLKARILSNRGHLSNETAVSLMCDHANRDGPCTIWLAHLSRVNNTPKLALGYAKATVSVLTGCPVVIDVAKRDHISARWSPGRSALQLSMF